MIIGKMKERNKPDDPGGVILQVLLRQRLTCRNISLTAAEKKCKV